MATLGANVTPVPHTIQYAETLEDDLLRQDFAIPLNYRPEQVPQLGDSYPGDTAPWGYIVIEVGSLRPSGGKHSDAYTTTVQYAKPKIPFTSGIDNVKEVKRLKRTGRRGRFMGERVFLTVDSQADTLAETHLKEGTPMETSGVYNKALLREKEIERRWRVGLARITCQYDTYEEWGGSPLYIGQGILEGHADIGERELYDFKIDGTYKLDEPFLVGTGVDAIFKEWQLVKGMGLYPYPRGVYSIRVTLDTNLLASVMALVGKTNSDACPKILSAPADTLWFNDFDFTQHQYGTGKLYDFVAALAYEPDGWDHANVAQRKRLVIDSNTNVAGWILDTSAGNTKDFTPLTSASFSLLNGFLA
ncbi:MAG: hypothetical protein IMZ62_10460 [Chloroflexi bacterium]|nr:hypothetical protein [Chloroflexota bacterium]